VERVGVRLFDFAARNGMREFREFREKAVIEGVTAAVARGCAECEGNCGAVMAGARRESD
jgi:hypothetical protein